MLFLLLPFAVSAEEDRTETVGDRMPDEYRDFLDAVPEDIRDRLPESLFSSDSRDATEAAGQLSDFSYLAGAVLQSVGLHIGDCLRLLAQIVLKEADLADQQNRIDALQLVLANQEKELSDYQAQIADILGVRTRIVQELSAQLASARISATVDEKTGDIVLDSSLMFETGSSTLKAEGLAQLNRLIPVYLGVLLQDEYRDYVAEIIIEGHTDSTGSYEHNLELSQNRALNVAKYCLNMGTLTQTQKTRLKAIITAQGRSFSDPVYDENGVEDQERSRRVEIKFRLKDAEMIQRMNSILSSME